MAAGVLGIARTTCAWPSFSARAASGMPAMMLSTSWPGASAERSSAATASKVCGFTARITTVVGAALLEGGGHAAEHGATQRFEHSSAVGVGVDHVDADVRGRGDAAAHHRLRHLAAAHEARAQRHVLEQGNLRSHTDTRQLAYSCRRI